MATATNKAWFIQRPHECGHPSAESRGHLHIDAPKRAMTDSAEVR